MSEDFSEKEKSKASEESEESFFKRARKIQV
jgi:hypothetical protein